MGIQLRQDDPIKMVDIIKTMYSYSNKHKDEEDSSRMAFMMETIKGVKNNNMPKNKGLAFKNIFYKF